MIKTPEELKNAVQYRLGDGFIVKLKEDVHVFQDAEKKTHHCHNIIIHKVDENENDGCSWEFVDEEMDQFLREDVEKLIDNVDYLKSCRRLYANVRIGFDKDGECVMNVDTNDIPITMVLEALSALVKGISQNLIEESGKEIPAADMEGYINSRIDLDRSVLIDLLKFKLG